MKICIVIQSEPFRNSAGMRIRYDRFRESLAGSDVTIDAIPCKELAASRSLDHDVYVFCKTFDTAALLLARRIKAAGKIVGQDLFDDYFSQYQDARLERFRQWMRDMAPATHFAICSTQRMVEVVRPYMPDIRITAIEDPITGFDPQSVADLAEAKARHANDNKVLEIVWFGIGDNPFFPVGLSDLAMCEPSLDRMKRRGWDVRLRIVTNRRPFHGAGAEQLRRISVGYEIMEWTEQLEQEALKRAPVAIIPVNGQSFSRAKSMNRAVTAISAGCQVLSIGYPLYDRLDEFIYRSAEDLLSDLQAGSLRVGRSGIDQLSSRMSALADPHTAAMSFVDEARKAQAAFPDVIAASSLVCLIHGRGSTIDLHKAAVGQGGLSVATIFNKAAWNFPVRFDRVGREIVMRVTPELAKRFNLPLRHADQVTRILGLDLVDVDNVAMGTRQLFLDLSDKAGLIAELAIYEDVMQFAEECCLAAFPGVDLLVSDTSQLVRQPAIYRRRTFVAPVARKRDRPAASPRFREAPALPIPASSSGKHPFWGLGRIVSGRQKEKSRNRGYELLAGSPLFDAQWYLETYPDVAASGMDPALHYLEHGWREGRNPGPAFSTRKYLRSNSDVAERGINPLLHYIEYGQWEGRRAPPAIKGSLVS